MREAFTSPVDLQIIDKTLQVRLDPASAPRRSKALAASVPNSPKPKPATPAPT